MDVFAADDDRQRSGERHKIHDPVGVEKNQIQAYSGYGNQLNDREFSNYSIAVGQHERHCDQKGDDLSLSDLARQLLNLFY